MSARAKAYTVFAAVTLGYLAAILQRSSLGVAALDATARFDVAATVLSMLGVAQIVVYAAAQIPVGAAIDRFGPKPLLLIGAILMAAGQTVVAVAEHIAPAVAGRALVGLGDAMTFTSGIRALALWFEGRRLPFLSQIFGQLGGLGQLVSAIPFMALLHAAGWVTAFLSAAGVAVFAFAVMGLAMLVAPHGPHRQPRAALSARETVRHVVEALRRPGTQLGFWAHFVSQSTLVTFTLMWGVPFLTLGVGLSREAATSLIGLTVLVSIVSGPLLGLLSARFPLRRSNVILSIIGATAAVWLAMLLWPGTPPLWLLVVLIVVLSIGGPGSMIGFDYARTYNPARQHGSATGIVNVGGFLAAFTMMFLIGAALDLASAGGASLYSLGSFRVAFVVPFPVVGFGVAMLLVTRRRLRRAIQEEEGIAIAPLWLAAARRLRRAF